MYEIVMLMSKYYQSDDTKQKKEILNKMKKLINY
jgi:hypothetical protein